jgi:transcriptional regulator of acetoin/glycerol metabolism
LENLIERAVLSTTSEFIQPHDLKLDEIGETIDSGDERAQLMHCIVENKYNLKKTAEFLGVSRTTLYRKLHRHGIQAR